MRVMGLDLSLTSTGVCITEEGKDILLTKVKTNSSESWFDRISRIITTILSYANEYKVEHITIENYSYGSSQGRELLGELHGVVMYNLECEGYTYRKISPTQVKQFGCGRGQAPKRPADKAKSTWAKTWVVEEINKRYDKAFRLADNDICDAYIIALLTEKAVQIENGLLDIYDLPDHQQQALATFLNIKLKKTRRK